MYTLADVVAASAEARYCTPAQFDHALASGKGQRLLRDMLVSGATLLALAEGHWHPEGTTGADVARRESILDGVMRELELRLLAAMLRGFHVHDDGDDEYPATVVYADTHSTGADWADNLV
ncbi:MAG: hypothetical protein HOQ07_06640 [Sinomonas sp.]|nr:hypothetical protein [Sinomonas sp.]